MFNDLRFCKSSGSAIATSITLRSSISLSPLPFTLALVHNDGTSQGNNIQVTY